MIFAETCQAGDIIKAQIFGAVVIDILTDKNEKLYQIHINESGFDIDFKKVVLIKYLSMSPDENVRNILNHIQKEEQNHGKMIYDYMKANNMYG